MPTAAPSEIAASPDTGPDQPPPVPGVDAARAAVPEPLPAPAPDAAWGNVGETICGFVDRHAQVALTQDQCVSIYSGLWQVVLWSLLGLLAVSVWGLIAKRGAPEKRAPVSPWAALPPDTESRFRHLLLGLPRWDHAQTRRNLVTLALGNGHPLIQDIPWGGSPADEAMAILTACLTCGEPAANGLPPACALLARIQRDWPAPERSATIDVLKEALTCT